MAIDIVEPNWCEVGMIAGTETASRRLLGDHCSLLYAPSALRQAVEVIQRRPKNGSMLPGACWRQRGLTVLAS